MTMETAQEFEGGPEILSEADVPAGAAAISTKLVALHQPDSPEGEALAALRNHLISHHLRDRRRALAICGPSSGVGTTFISVNLAASMAQAGLRTLLIDGNLRSPGVSDLITPMRNTPGLAEFLADENEDSKVVLHEVRQNLHVLYAGQATANPSDLLALHRFRDLIDKSIRGFDLTIIDCPPSSHYGDARRIASLVRHALVIARRNYTLTSDLKTLVRDLEEDRVNVVGSFLNDVP